MFFVHYQQIRKLIRPSSPTGKSLKQLFLEIIEHTFSMPKMFCGTFKQWEKKHHQYMQLISHFIHRIYFYSNKTLYYNTHICKSYLICKHSAENGIKMHVRCRMCSLQYFLPIYREAFSWTSTHKRIYIFIPYRFCNYIYVYTMREFERNCICGFALS